MVGANPYQTLPTAEYDLRSAPIPPSASQLPPPDQFAFSTTLRKANPDDPYAPSGAAGAANHSAYPPYASPPRPTSHKPNASDASQRYASSIDFQHASPSSRSAPVSASAHFTHLSVAQCLETLHCPSLQSGLTPLLVHEARREAGGYNEFAVRAADEPWRKFLAQFQEPLILLLLGSAAVSLLIGQIDDAVSITIAITIVISVAFYQEQKSEKSLEALNKLVPHYCHLIRDGVTSSVLANELVPGDIVTFSTGDRIPADIRICECVSLEIDESTLTGEIKPRRKHADVVPHASHSTTTEAAPNGHGGHNGTANGSAQEQHAAASSLTSINERENIGFMGTLVKSGHGRGVVVGTGASTEFGMIFSLVDEVVEKRTPLQLSMDELAKKLSIISFGVIAVICLMGVWQRRPWLEMFTIGVSLAVAAIPEGLPIVVTVTLALGVLRMSHRKAIVKKLPSVETLGSVSVICSDKTGTLTTNEMAVVSCFTAEDGIIDVAHHLSHRHSQALSRILLTGNLCNNSHRNELGTNVGQATDVALVNILRTFGLEDQRPYFRRSSEVAFDSDAKFMAVTGVLSTAGVGAAETVYVKGAFEVVMDKCTTVLGADGSPVRLDETLRTKIQQAADKLSSQGLRVVGFASGSNGSLDARTLTFSGLQAMQDPPRPGVKDAIALLARGGVQVVMITGDAEATAVAMARQLGILSPTSSTTGATPGVLTGRQIDALTERQLQERIGAVSVFARTTPRHKMAIIAALQAGGAVVAMTGDGVNDAPALKMADIGISMGKGGTDVAKEAADVILVDDNFATILAAVEEGKGIFYNIQNFLSFQLSTAVAALTLITLSTAFRLKLPLNAMQILFINILMDGPPSQSLGVDPVDRKSVMARPPRAKNAPVLSRRLLYRIAFSATMVTLGTLYVYVHELVPADIQAPAGAGKVADQRDSTMTFTCFVLLDLVSAVQNRGLHTPLTANRMLGVTVSISLLAQLAMVYLPPLQGVFQTTSLAFADLVFLAAIAAVSFGLHELRRTYERRISHEETKDLAAGPVDWA